MSSSFTDLVYHATLENQLIELFPKDLFKKLQLPLSTSLTIYQGLPRYSKPSYPRHVFVKQEFSDLSVLKKRCIDKALLSVYNQRPLYNAHSITLFTYVVPGGLGDYFANQFLKKTLKKKFPFLKISTICLIHKTAPLKGIEETQDDHLIYFSSQEDLQPHFFTKALLKLLRNSSMIVQIPTFYPYWDLLLTTLKSIPSSLSFPKMETIGEYGFINSKDFYPTTNARCLGLHFLEYGLLLEDFKTNSHLTMLPKDTLKLLLKEKTLHGYKSSTHFYFAYLCTDYGHYLYLYSLLLYLAKDKENIDLCTPDIGLFLKAIDKNISLFQEAHIKEIQIYYKDKCSCLTIQETGKTLRLIHTGHLNHEQFKLYLALSEEPVGIRGNLSLSEIISLNKTYFYDLLEHNIILYYGLIAMARTHTPDALKLLELYEQKEDPLKAAYKCAALMQDTPAFQELKLLNEKIYQEHSAGVHLENIVSRSLNHYENSSLENQESSLVKAFINNKLSFEDLIIKLRSFFLQNSN